MQSYLLEVRNQNGNEPLSQGTAWFIRTDVVVTAFHVVGSREIPGWFHDQPGIVAGYFLIAAGQRIQLDPLGFDNDADVAVLRLSQATMPVDVLSLDTRLPPTYERWNGTAFPSFHRAMPFSLTGHVANVHPNASRETLQLTVEQGSRADWRGVSGCPVCIDDSVVGMITSVTSHTDTAWATTAQSILQLTRTLGVPAAERKLSNPAVTAFTEFYLGSDNTPAPFGGRADELRFLNQWIDEQSAPKYLLLLGPAGRGKSALLAYWAQILHQRTEWVTIFYPISIRFNTNLAASVYKSIVTQLAALHRQAVPTTIMYQIENLRSKITEYLKMPLPDGRGVILILDGVDEAADWRMKADLFPPLLARENRLRIVVSARQRADDSTGTQILRDLGWDNSTAARTFQLQPLGLDGVADIVKRGAPHEWNSEQIDRISLRLFSLSQGDPLVTRLWLDALCLQTQQGHPIDEHKLSLAPPGLDGWFSDWWQHQRELRPTNQGVADEVVPAILGLLSCAWGPLTLDDLHTLLRLMPVPITQTGANLRAIIKNFDRLIIGGHNSQGYVFAHPQLGTYYCEQYLTAEEQRIYQDVLVLFCRNAIKDRREINQGPRIPQYVVRYYGAHLTQRQSAFLDYLQMLTSQWADAWKLESGTYAGFLMDIGRAWQVLQIENHRKIEEVSQSGELSSEILCVFFMCTVGSLAANFPPSLVVALIHYQVWTPRQALEYVAQMPSNSTQSYALARMIRLVPPNDQEYFLDITAKLTGMALGYVLQESADYLAEPVLRKALALTARERDLRGRARAAGKIISRFSSSSDRARMLGDLIGEIFEFYDVWGQGQLFAFLYNCTPPDDLLREVLKNHAITTALSLQDSYARAYVFVELFDTMPQNDEQLSVLIDSVLTVDKDTLNNWQYIELLIKVLSVLAQSDARWTPVSETALHEIEQLSSPEQQMSSMVDLIIALPQGSRFKREIQDRLFAKIEANPSVIENAIKILRHAVDPDERKRIIDLLDRLRFQSKDSRTIIRTLVELIVTSTDRKEDYFKEAYNELMRATQSSPRFAWEACLDMLCSVLPYNYLEQILSLTEGIGDDQLLAKCIVAFDPTLSLGIEEIINHYNQSKDQYEQILAFAEIIPHMPQPLRDRICLEKFNLAKELADGDQKGYALLRLGMLETAVRTKGNLLIVLDSIEGKAFAPSRWKCMAEFVTLSDILLSQDQSLLGRLLPLDLLQDSDRLLGTQIIEEWAENIVTAILRLGEKDALLLLTRLFDLVKDASLKDARLIIGAQTLRLIANSSAPDVITRTVYEDLKISTDPRIRAKSYAVLASMLSEEQLVEALGVIFENWHKTPHFGDHREVLYELLQRLTPNMQSAAVRLINDEVALQPDLNWEGLAATLVPYKDDGDLDVAIDDIWDISEPLRYRILAKFLFKLNHDLFDHAFKVSLHAQDRYLPEALTLMLPHVLERSDNKTLYVRFTSILNRLADSNRAVVFQVVPVIKPIIERLSIEEDKIKIAAYAFKLACWHR